MTEQRWCGYCRKWIDLPNNGKWIKGDGYSTWACEDCKDNVGNGGQ